MKTYREVVDGQHRLRTITEFIDGNFALGNNTKEYSGKKYEDLEEEDQRRFLAYQIGVVQFNKTGELPPLITLKHHLHEFVLHAPGGIVGNA